MLETVTLYGNISEISYICGSLNLPTEYIEPKTEQLTIEPRKEQQIFEPNVGKYYDKVTVESVSTESIEVMSSNTDTIIVPTDGKFIEQVTVKGDSNLVAENIRKGISVLGVTGTMEGAWDTSQITNTYNMFYQNKNLIEAPSFNVENVKTSTQMFDGCSNLLTVPDYNFVNNTMMTNMFNNCNNLETIGLIDCSSIYGLNGAFYRCNSLKNMKGLKDIGKGYAVSVSSGSSSYQINLYYASKLTHESLINIINNLYDIKTKGCNIQDLYIGSTNVGKLTADEISIATSKGWNVL